ncbi:MAG: nitroreductase family protein [Alphaproteobacteria bacterium]
MYIKTLMAAAVVSVLAVSGARAELVTQSLPKPDMVGGKTLMQSLQERKSVREFGRRAVNDQTLADMLWAAVGVNRQDGKRTIPTALNSQDLTVYVLKFDGVWQYDARGHKLIQVSDKDLRPLLGTQDYAKDAALDLVYVSTSDVATNGAMHAGSAYQNVGLYCADKGLNNVVRGILKADLERAEAERNQWIVVSRLSAGRRINKSAVFAGSLKYLTSAKKLVKYKIYYYEY